MANKELCPKCGNKYERLSQHWAFNENHRQSFTDKQKQIIAGLTMGDGHISEKHKNPHIVCNMSSPNYLKFLDREFGILSNGVTFLTTAEENAKRDRCSGFNLNAKSENYSDMYRWKCKTHPELEEFAEWYSTGRKIWPQDIELTPIVLKHWYCGDGCRDISKSKGSIEISMANEINNLEKVNQIFENVELPAPSNYNINKRKSGGRRCSAQWTVDQSKELWEYMGEPLPDFEYKWPEQYR